VTHSLDQRRAEQRYGGRIKSFTRWLKLARLAMSVMALDAVR
jgi:hypothetical protein